MYHSSHCSYLCTLGLVLWALTCHCVPAEHAGKISACINWGKTNPVKCAQTDRKLLQVRASTMLTLSRKFTAHTKWYTSEKLLQLLMNLPLSYLD